MTDTNPPPHPPITAVKPQRATRGATVTQRPRVYAASPTAQHALRPSEEQNHRDVTHAVRE
jgi:hypothetical protein